MIRRLPLLLLLLWALPAQAQIVQNPDLRVITRTAGVVPVGDGTKFVGESGATLRTSIGLGTMATQNANAVAITGGTGVFTDVAGSGTKFLFRQNTTDGADNRAMIFCGGGGGTISRGGYFAVFGADHATTPGAVEVATPFGSNIYLTYGTVRLQSDNQKLVLGAAGESDLYLTHAGTNSVLKSVATPMQVESGSSCVCLISGATMPQYYDAGGTFYWRDVDDSNNSRMTLSSATGLLNFYSASEVLAISFNPAGDSYMNGGDVGINEAEPDYKLDVNGSLGITPGASVTPVDNGDVVFQLTSNTSLTIKAKGSDGVVRSVSLTLAP